MSTGLQMDHYKGIIMAVREICRMGHPALRAENRDLTRAEILSDEFQILIQDMQETMIARGGIGLAAPQIGINWKLAIIEIPEDNGYEQEAPGDLLIIVNPVLTVLDEKKQGLWEGCLSVPGLRGYVERPQKIRVDYLNEKAEEVTLEACDFLATVFQHELDHLFGTLYVDKLKDPKLLSFEEEFIQFELDEE
jgi:peptide deformylase